MGRTYREIRKAILEALKDGEHHSYGELERKVDTNWKTIRTHCQDLEIFNAVQITDQGVKITNLGRKALEKL